MNVASSKAKKLARSLLRKNRDGKTWRQIAQEDYQGRVSFATLNRLAINRGEWIPKDEEILSILGLLTIRSPYAIMPRWFNRTPEALTWFLHTRGLAKGIADSTRAAQQASKQWPL
jgi:hypothetical protein